MRIFKEVTFDAAHHLPNVPSGHKCGRLHGHTYRVRVWVDGWPDRHTGWIVDYADIDAAVQPVIAMIDHHGLNSVIENPTTENVAMWLWEKIKGGLPGICRIEVYESSTTGCVYEG